MKARGQINIMTNGKTIIIEKGEMIPDKLLSQVPKHMITDNDTDVKVSKSKSSKSKSSKVDTSNNNQLKSTED